MPEYRFKTSTHGRNMTGARALWCVTGVMGTNFGKPIITVTNSFAQFVPGHAHLYNTGQLVARETEKTGAITKESSAIAIDDGVTMRHSGILYSLPSHDLIVDSTEYMVNARCAGTLMCISNCDKITPGILAAVMRLNVPTIFVSGDPMKAGKAIGTTNVQPEHRLDLIDAMIESADDNVSDQQVEEVEQGAYPTCDSCSSMFTASSMNCLAEALGLSLPSNGSCLTTRTGRKELFLEASRMIVEITKHYYEQDDETVLPHSIATKKTFEDAMTMDITMGGSANTILHLLAVADEAGVNFKMADVDRLNRVVPYICKTAPNNRDYYVEDIHRADDILTILKELDKAGRLHTDIYTIHAPTLKDAIKKWNVTNPKNTHTIEHFKTASGGVHTTQAFSQSRVWKTLDLDREKGCIHNIEHTYLQDDGLTVLFDNVAERGCVVKTAGVDENILKFTSRARVLESQETAVEDILDSRIVAGDVVIIRYGGPKDGPGMQEMLYPTSYLKPKSLDKACILLMGRHFSGGTSDLSVDHASPEATEGGATGLVHEDDTIEIGIPNRSVDLKVSDEELTARRAEMEARGSKAWKPENRDCYVSAALRAYGATATSADRGAVRGVSQIER